MTALAASAALFIHYLDPVGGAFCGIESGCESVRRSPISYFGTPLLNLPLAGLIGYAVVLFLSVSRPRSRELIVLASLGAVGAVVFLLLQAFYVRAYCWLCLIVDTAAIGAAVFALAFRASIHRREAPSEPPADPDRGSVDRAVYREVLRPWAWYFLGALCIAAPMLWAAVRPVPPVPSVIRDLYEPDKVDIVEFADFQCPFCRRLHEVMEGVIAEYPPEQIRLLRMNVPLPQHEHAETAARAYVCAEEQGQADAMASALVQIHLSAENIRRAAATLGVDLGALDRCMQRASTDMRIARETALLEEAGFQGLPTTYIEGKRFVGVISPEALRDAIDRARRGETEQGVPGALYLALLVVLAALVAWLGRRPRDNLEHGGS